MPIKNSGITKLLNLVKYSLRKSKGLRNLQQDVSIGPRRDGGARPSEISPVNMFTKIYIKQEMVGILTFTGNF